MFNLFDVLGKRQMFFGAEHEVVPLNVRNIVFADLESCLRFSYDITERDTIAGMQVKQDIEFLLGEILYHRRHGLEVPVQVTLGEEVESKFGETHRWQLLLVIVTQSQYVLVVPFADLLYVFANEIKILLLGGVIQNAD